MKKNENDSFQRFLIWQDKITTGLEFPLEQNATDQAFEGNKNNNLLEQSHNSLYPFIWGPVFIAL